ncbi:MAG TPA: hypothetical protein VN723_14620, partial [Rhizomicrobium sp.]|nr:hypothetical protein [Rhizomicrobium sp.]
MNRIIPAAILLFSLSAGAAWAAESVPDGFTFAAAGDMIGPYHPLPTDPDFAKLKALFQGADIGFANQEGSIFDLKTFRGFPAAENGGGYPL